MPALPVNYYRRIYGTGFFVWTSNINYENVCSKNKRCCLIVYPACRLFLDTQLLV